MVDRQAGSAAAVSLCKGDCSDRAVVPADDSVSRRGSGAYFPLSMDNQQQPFVPDQLCTFFDGNGMHPPCTQQCTFQCVTAICWCCHNCGMFRLNTIRYPAATTTPGESPEAHFEGDRSANGHPASSKGAKERGIAVGGGQLHAAANPTLVN
jgi:hypothetical protein